MKHIYTIVTVALLLAVSAWAGAAAPSQSAARQRLLDEEPRLEKRVTLRLKRDPLSEVVAALARQTEVAMRASADVADEPAFLSVTDQPAKEVMHHLAILFGYRWTRTGNPGGYRYEIYQDLRSKQEEEALRHRRHARALAALQAALREKMRLAQRPAELLLREAAALECQSEARPDATQRSAVGMPAAGAGGSYRLRELADPCRRALLQVASLLTPDQWQSLVRGETVHFSTLTEPGAVPLPPAPAQVLRAARPSALPPGVRAGFVTAEDEAAYALEERRSREAWQRARGFCVSARLTLASAEARAEAVLSITPTAVMPVDGPEAPALLPTLIVVGHGPVTPEAHEPSEMPRSWKEDPVLSRKCRLQPAPTPAGEAEAAALSDHRQQFPEMLAAIAESYGINLVADAYRSERSDGCPLLVGEEQSLYEALSQYVAPYAGWRREGAFFRARRHRWYHLRPREIPDRVVRHWAADLRRAGGFTLEEAARLVSSLRDEQLAQFEERMREAGLLMDFRFDEENTAARRQRAVLRAYGSLPSAQRRLLETGGSLALGAMPPQARWWLQTALTSGGHATTAGSPGEALPPDTLALAAPPKARAGVRSEVWIRCGTGMDRVEAFRIPLPRVVPIARERSAGVS